MCEKIKNINAIFEVLRRYCEQEEFRGYDPFDGLIQNYSNPFLLFVVIVFSDLPENRKCPVRDRILVKTEISTIDNVPSGTQR